MDSVIPSVPEEISIDLQQKYQLTYDCMCRIEESATKLLNKFTKDDTFNVLCEILDSVEFFGDK